MLRAALRQLSASLEFGRRGKEPTGQCATETPYRPRVASAISRGAPNSRHKRRTRCLHHEIASPSSLTVTAISTFANNLRGRFPRNQCRQARMLLAVPPGCRHEGTGAHPRTARHRFVRAHRAGTRSCTTGSVRHRPGQRISHPASHNVQAHRPSAARRPIPSART